MEFNKNKLIEKLQTLNQKDLVKKVEQNEDSKSL